MEREYALKAFDPGTNTGVLVLFKALTIGRAKIMGKNYCQKHGYEYLKVTLN